MTFEDLLHPAVSTASLDHYAAKHFREATINAITSVFDMIRSRTGLDYDGSELVDVAFSEASPHLIAGDLATKSGQNAHRGAMQMLRGLYQGVRNPGSHSLSGEWTPERAAQLMIVASHLASVVETARAGSFLRTAGVYAGPTDSVGRTFIRFLPDGKVLSVNVASNEALSDIWVPDWLTPDWADFSHFALGNYQVNGNRIEITDPIPDGTIQYSGQIVGSTLKLRWYSSVTKKSGSSTFVFRAARWPTS